ncbi:MAG: hypothetical protein GY703_19545 [Gammaproteobacteria bacterium]|nr:hypothetical protein [Gammaproteobacteria bacterium]
MIIRLRLHPLQRAALSPTRCWLLSVMLALAPSVYGDILFSSGTGLFAESDGQVLPLNTGFLAHNFLTASKDGRFAVFSSPDPTIGNGTVPSSDIYSFDRETGSTRRIVDHMSSVSGGFNTLQFVPATAALSPDNQLLAYGVALTTRQGLANPSRGVTLAVAGADNGIITDNPAGLNPVSDSLGAAFVGIDWDPDGNSFVTPSYVSIQSAMGTPVDLPGIVRFSQQGNGSWVQTPLTTPAYFNNVLPPQARTYIYPALSPSGAGLAFFSLFWPDVLGGTQPVTARLIVANSDGSQPSVVFTFNPGLYPAGLSWSRDGTQLIVAFGDQFNAGTGWLPSADVESAVIRAVNIQTSSISAISGIDKGYFPTAADPLPAPDNDGDNSGGEVCFPVPLNDGGISMICL